MTPAQQQFFFAQQMQQQQQQQVGFGVQSGSPFLSAQHVALSGLGLPGVGGAMVQQTTGGHTVGMPPLLPLQNGFLQQQQQQWGHLRPESLAWGSGVMPVPQGMIHPAFVQQQQQHIQQQQQLGYLQELRSAPVGVNVVAPQFHGGDGMHGSQQWAHELYGNNPLSQEPRRPIQDGMRASESTPRGNFHGIPQGNSYGNSSGKGNSDSRPHENGKNPSGNWSRGGNVGVSAPRSKGGWNEKGNGGVSAPPHMKGEGWSEKGNVGVSALPHSNGGWNERGSLGVSAPPYGKGGWNANGNGNGNGNVGFSAPRHMQGGRGEREPARQNFSLQCIACDRNFSNNQQLNAHKNTHMKCDVAGCSFEASGKVVKAHKQSAHNLAEFDLPVKRNPWKTKESEQEITSWCEERKRNYPSTANVKRKADELRARFARGELVDEDAKKRRERLKEILAQQAKLGVPVAEVPAYYMSDRYGSLKGNGESSSSSAKRGCRGHQKNGKRGHDRGHGLEDKEPPLKVARTQDASNIGDGVEMKEIQSQANGKENVGTQAADPHEGPGESKKVCPFFQRKGWCKKGARCQFTHVRTPKKKKEPEPPKPRGATLLAKLLESDIRMEKSYLLQAFRFFVKNSFLLEFPQKPLEFNTWQEGDERNGDANVERRLDTELEEICKEAEIEADLGEEFALDGDGEVELDDIVKEVGDVGEDFASDGEAGIELEEIVKNVEIEAEEVQLEDIEGTDEAAGAILMGGFENGDLTVEEVLVEDFERSDEETHECSQYGEPTAEVVGLEDFESSDEEAQDAGVA